MTMRATRDLFRTDQDEPGSKRLKASTGLQSAVVAALNLVLSVQEVRVLHRPKDRSKFFVILSELTTTSVGDVVCAMLQIENAFPEQFDYDTITRGSESLVPESAQVVLGR